MKAFRYKVTIYPLEKFSHLQFFCSESGECSLEEVFSGAMEKFEELLNELGEKGWELVQVISKPSGIVAIWKKAKEVKDGKCF